MENIQSVESTEIKKPWGINLKTFNILLHVSQLAGYVVPGAGFVAPIVMWITNKDEYEEVDRHGKIVLNWMVSSLIYMAISFVLIFALGIGLIGIAVIPIVCTIFAIIGAIKASEGEYWEYPMTIKFFK